MDISVIIRARNEAAHIGRVIDAIQRQAFDSSVEIVVVDSASTDDTPRIAAERGCRVVAIPVETFTWGRALNIGARHARGDVCINLSAHAEPADPDWLHRLTDPFREGDESLAGVFGRQLPIPGGDPFEAVELDLWFPDGERATKSRWFSNANGAYRKSVWRDYPFDEELMVQEDCVWSVNLEERGYHTLYEPRARVFHNHDLEVSPRDSLNGIFTRWYWRSYTMYRLTPDYRGSQVRYALGNLLRFGIRDYIQLRASGRVGTIPKIPVYECIRQFASWLGARHHQQGAYPLALTWRDRYLAPRPPMLLRLMGRFL